MLLAYHASVLYTDIPRRAEWRAASGSLDLWLLVSITSPFQLGHDGLVISDWSWAHHTIPGESMANGREGRPAMVVFLRWIR